MVDSPRSALADQLTILYGKLENIKTEIRKNCPKSEAILITENQDINTSTSQEKPPEQLELCKKLNDDQKKIEEDINYYLRLLNQ
jgi:hypothetical protein